MKKCLSALFLIVVLYVGDMFFGNPVCYWIAQKRAQLYIAENYTAELQLQIDEKYYDWYSGGAYMFRVTSQVSPDTYFDLSYDSRARLAWDGYEHQVLNKGNIIARLNAQYEQEVRSALEKASFPVYNLGCTLFYDLEPIRAQLEPDKAYDISGWAAQQGEIWLVCRPETVTEERLHEVVLEFCQLLETSNITAARAAVTIVDDEGNSLSQDYADWENLAAENVR